MSEENIQRDVVAGLEMNAVPHLKYLQCDGCGAQFDPRDTKNGMALRQRAREAGWACVEATNDDRCPACVEALKG